MGGIGIEMMMEMYVFREEMQNSGFSGMMIMTHIFMTMVMNVISAIFID